MGRLSDVFSLFSEKLQEIHAAESINSVLGMISAAFLPALLAIILIHALLNKVNVYDLFIEGCREGLKTAGDIMPFIIAVFLAITLMTESGALSAVEDICGPVLSAAGVPEELTAFMIMRPVSGSGTLVIIEQLAEKYGPDSYIARCACVMMGSSETLLYAIAVYFGITSVKKTRHTIFAGIIGYIIGIWLSIVLCILM